MAQCSSCGYQNEQDAVFCEECGTNLGKDTAEQVLQTESSEPSATEKELTLSPKARKDTDELEWVQGALTTFEAKIQANPNDDQAWFDKGVMLSALSRTEEALASYGRVIQLNPRFDQAWVNIGNSLLSQRRLEEAFATFRRGLDLNPNHHQALLGMGKTLGISKRPAEALPFLERAAALKPDDEEICFCRGTALLELERWGECVECFEKVLQHQPRNGQAWWSKGMALMELKRHEDALVCFDRALQVNPHNEDALFGKGAVLSSDELKRYSEAIPYFSEAHRLGHPQAAKLIDICRRMRQQEEPTAHAAQSKLGGGRLGNILSDLQCGEPDRCIRAVSLLRKTINQNLVNFMLDEKQMKAILRGHAGLHPLSATELAESRSGLESVIDSGKHLMVCWYALTTVAEYGDAGEEVLSRLVNAARQLLSWLEERRLSGQGSVLALVLQTPVLEETIRALTFFRIYPIVPPLIEQIYDGEFVEAGIASSHWAALVAMGTVGCDAQRSRVEYVARNSKSKEDRNAAVAALAAWGEAPYDEIARRARETPKGFLASLFG